MRNFYLASKDFYHKQSFIYRLAIILLGWLVIYTIFDKVIFRTLDHSIQNVAIDLASKNAEIDTLKLRMQEMANLEKGSAYRNWQESYRHSQALQGKVQQTLNAGPAEQSQDVIRRILQDENNVTLLQINNTPEAIYTPLSEAFDRTIYQEGIHLTIQTDYFSTLHYIERLESSFPNVHWKTFKYDVSDYPLAKAEMEFMILYEKNH